MRRKAANKRDCEERFGTAVACDYELYSIKAFFNHRYVCELCKERGVELGDLIACELCSFVSADLSPHYKEEHNCSNSRCKEMGYETMTEKAKLRMGQVVTKSIMANPAERLRRSRLLGNLNKREDFRERASKTAMKTSARQDVQDKRAEVLARWRKENPEDFYNKCIKQMHKYKSKPEKWMYMYIKERFPTYDFKSNRQIKSVLFDMNLTSRKQIDIYAKRMKVIIEVDGPHHFREIHGQLEVVQKKDLMLEKYVATKDILLIRVHKYAIDYTATLASKVREREL